MALVKPVRVSASVKTRASWLEMSRIPVREALRRLEADGLLTLAPYRGMVIFELDHQTVMELYFMRELLKGTAAGRRRGGPRTRRSRS